jgi:hypothetical protein
VYRREADRSVRGRQRSLAVREPAPVAGTA